MRAPVKKVSAHVVTVVGYRRGARHLEKWHVVFDLEGAAVVGAPCESAAAVQIRYCELHGVPAEWVVYGLPISPGELDGLRGLTSAVLLSRERKRESYRETYLSPIRSIGRKVPV